MTEVTPTRPSLLPVVLGFALAGLLILVLGFWSARPAASGPPAITLRSPSRDTTLAGPVRVQFETSVPLRLQASGWGHGKYHVHALVDTVELMPGAAELKEIRPNLYEWVLPAPPRAHRLQLIWAFANHARVTDGASDSIRIAPLSPTPQPAKVSNR